MFTIYAWASGSTSLHTTKTVEHAALWVPSLAAVSDRVVITHESVYGQIEVRGPTVSIIGGASAEMTALYLSLRRPPVSSYATGFTSGYCDTCKVDGDEARTVAKWTTPV